MTGRSSIPETVRVDTRRRGVLDARLKRGMTVEERDYAFPRHDAPEFCSSPRPPRSQGRRESRVPDAPAAARGVVGSTRVSHHRSTGIRPSLRNGFNGLFRTLPGDRACLPPSSPRSFASQELDTSVGVSGPHDFAVRVQRHSSLDVPRPPHPAPNVRDDRETPLVWDGTAEDYAGDLGQK